MRWQPGLFDAQGSMRQGRDAFQRVQELRAANRQQMPMGRQPGPMPGLQPMAPQTGGPMPALQPIGASTGGQMPTLGNPMPSVGGGQLPALQPMSPVTGGQTPTLGGGMPIAQTGGGFQVNTPEGRPMGPAGFPMAQAQPFPPMGNGMLAQPQVLNQANVCPTCGKPR